MDDKLGWMINLDGRYDFDMASERENVRVTL